MCKHEELVELGRASHAKKKEPQQEERLTMMAIKTTRRPIIY